MNSLGTKAGSLLSVYAISQHNVCDFVRILPALLFCKVEAWFLTVIFTEDVNWDFGRTRTHAEAPKMESKNDPLACLFSTSTIFAASLAFLTASISFLTRASMSF